MVIEVDGPHHYDKAERLDQVAMQKQQLLEKMGFKVKRIVYKQWRNLDQKGKKSLLEQCLIKTSATEDRDLSVRSDSISAPSNQAVDSTLPVAASGLQATAAVFVPKASLRAAAPVFMPNAKSANHGEGVEPIMVTHGIEWLEKADSIKGKSLPDDKSGVLSTQHDSLCKKEDEPINCWQEVSANGLFTHHEERTSKIENVESAAPIQKAGGVEGMPQQEDVWQTVTRKKNHQKKSSMDKSRNSTQNIPRK